MAEWSKAHDWKSCVPLKGTVSSTTSERRTLGRRSALSKADERRERSLSGVISLYPPF